MNYPNPYRRIVLLMSLAILFYSCEEKTDWNLQSSSAFIFVDAILTNENKPQEIKIYSSSPEFNGASLPYSGATVKVTNGRRTWDFPESTNSKGTYLSEPFRATAGFNYILIISYGEIIDTAIASMAPISPLQKNTIEPVDDLYKYIYSGSQLPAMTEVYYNWSKQPSYCENYGFCEASETFYTLNSIEVGEEFAPAKQEILFPSGTIIIRRKYSLSDDHQVFVRSLLIETEWRGGIFDIEQGNVPTNFRHGTRGWFAACMVLTDTTIVK